MKKLPAGSAALLFLLMAELLTLPADAQNGTAPLPDAPVPLHALSVGGVSFYLWIGPEVHSSYTGPCFTLKDGQLNLKDRGSLGKTQDSPLLWSGALGSEPRVFTIKVTKDSEELDDADGNLLWLHGYDPPALTLTLGVPLQPDLRRSGTLADAEGHTLWSGMLTITHTSGTVPKPAGMTTETRGWFRYQHGGGSVALLNSEGQLLWKGRAAGNVGLKVIDPQGQGYAETLGIPGPALPPGKVLTLMLSAVPGQVTLLNADRQPLETEPLTLGRLTVTSNNHDSDRFFQASVAAGTTILTPDVTMTLPPLFAGTVWRVYQDADGKVAETKKTTVTWNKPFRAPDGQMKAYRDEHTTNYDPTGRNTGGSGVSGDVRVSLAP